MIVNKEEPSDNVEEHQHKTHIQQYMAHLEVISPGCKVHGGSPVHHDSQLPALHRLFNRSWGSIPFHKDRSTFLKVRARIGTA